MRKETMFKYIKKNQEVFYIFDQSSISNMNNYPRFYNEFTKYWTILEELIAKGLFLIPEEVYLESKKAPPKIRNWVEKHKEAIIFETENMYHYLKVVLKKYRRMAYKNLKLTKKYHADPHLIALAIDLQKNGKTVIIVCDESPGSNKIPTVTNNFKINCITLLELFENLGVLNRQDSYSISRKNTKNTKNSKNSKNSKENILSPGDSKE